MIEYWYIIVIEYCYIIVIEYCYIIVIENWYIIVLFCKVSSLPGYCRCDQVGPGREVRCKEWLK